MVLRYFDKLSTQQPSIQHEGFGKQIQLVLGEVQIRWNLIFVRRDEPLYVFLNQLDRRCATSFAIIAKRAVLPCRQLEGNRMVFVVATLPLLALLVCHNTLI